MNFYEKKNVEKLFLPLFSFSCCRFCCHCPSSNKQINCPKWITVIVSFYMPNKMWLMYSIVELRGEFICEIMTLSFYIFLSFFFFFLFTSNRIYKLVLFNLLWFESVKISTNLFLASMCHAYYPHYMQLILFRTQ